MNEYEFADCLEFSRGRAAATDRETIKAIIPGCVRVAETGRELDLKGVDFVATLRRGATVNVDLKARRKGCSRHWRRSGPDFEPEPELALETWSAVPGDEQRGKVGWTLDESKITDYTLHVFDPSDTAQVFLLPFQLLRMAFRRRLSDWRGLFRCERQDNGDWVSECLFVPAETVIDAIRYEMRVGV